FFSRHPPRPLHRTVVIGWIGPLFWPYAYNDFIDYTLWPYGYDSFWPRAYDDIYQGIFGPYAVGATPSVDLPLAPEGRQPMAPATEGDLAQICSERAPNLTDWPIAQIAQSVEPNDVQRAALDQLRDAAAKAIALLHAACPTELPSTPPGRLAAMGRRLEVMLQAVDIVEPALHAFYQSLDDEQKARFNVIAPQEPQAARTIRSANQYGPDLTDACGGKAATFGDLPIERIAELVQPTPAQRTALDDLDAASKDAAELLKANCSEDEMLTPPGRLVSMARRLQALLQAVKTVQRVLARFYSSRSDEQKARFNALAQRAE